MTSGPVEFRRFTELRGRLVPYRWDWAEANRDRIAAHWAARRARQPALFDGRVLMVCGAELSGDRLDLRFFETGYSRLLAHIEWGFPDPNVMNGFAMGALRTRDGAFVLGEMAPHTAAAGRLYFPAGTPDLGDVRPDGSVDLEGSILREIAEETGLRLAPEAFAPDWTLVRESGRAALMRRLAIDRDGADVQASIEAHLARDPEPELSRIVLIRSPADIEPDRMPPFMPAYLRRVFEGR